VLLTSGAGAADVSATMLAVTDACGLRHVNADVTFTDLTLDHQATADEPPAIQVRRVTRRPVGYADLIEVDETVTLLVAGEITRAEARDRVARTVSTGTEDHPRGEHGDERELRSRQGLDEHLAVAGEVGRGDDPDDDESEGEGPGHEPDGA
jgi:hypothetical protein